MEGFFCSGGVSSCEMDEVKGYICGNCPVFSENALGGGFFCTRGRAE
ncbi:DUF2769 domain-containing protein [Patescibacteria group bacterium]